MEVPTFGGKTVAIDGNDWMRWTGHALVETVAQAESGKQLITIDRLARFGRTLWIRELTAPPEETAWPQFDELYQHWYHQCLVHPGLFYHPRPRRVLILGGGDYLAAWRVLMRRGVKYVKIADWDKKVAELVLAHIEWIRELSVHNDPRVDFREETNVVEYLPATEERYDAVIGDLVDAPTLAKFLPDFHKHILRILNPGGVFATQAGPLSLVPHDLQNLTASLAPYREEFASVWLGSYPIESFAYVQAFLYAWKDRKIQPQVPRRRDLDKRFIREAMAKDGPFYGPRVHRKLFILEPEFEQALGIRQRC